MPKRLIFSCLISLILTAPCLLSAAGKEPNLALRGKARSWLPESRPSPYAPEMRVNDGDPFTFWASTEPTTAPPKDIGIEWDQPQTFGCVVVRFHSLGYVPAPDGWRLEAQAGGSWRKIEALLENPDCEWWTFRFPPVRAQAVRLVVTRYSADRPSVCEMEVYARTPVQGLKRRAVLDGGFWSFWYEDWARHYAADRDLADELDAAHRAGLDTLILYTGGGGDGSFATVVPGTEFDQFPAWQGRDPLEALLAGADRLGMCVYIGDKEPHGYLGPDTSEKAAAFEQRLNRYRKQVLQRYGKHPSLVGYYINYECLPDSTGNDPAFPARKAEALAAFVKSVLPRLKVIQPVGLYQWRDARDAPWRLVTPRDLERFWRPFMAAAPHVDIYMVIDGVGTGLAPLAWTDAAQKCIRSLCTAARKQMWTDVECAEMGARYASMPIGRLAASTAVAARYADHIVTFDYLCYMSPGNGRTASRRLYEDYLAYRKRAASGREAGVP